MTLSRSLIEQNIYNAVLMAGTNTNVIFENPNAPRPAFPYTSIYFVNLAPSVNPWKYFNKDTNLVEYYECRQMTYRMNCYSDDALQAQDQASILQGSLIKYTVREELSDGAPISINVFKDVKNATLLIDDAFESRAMFDVVFDVGIENGTTSEDLGYFQTVGEIDWTNI